MENISVYIQNGFSSRSEYLHALAEDYGMPFHIVDEIANILGPNEDFDGLICSIEDIADSIDSEDFDF